MKTILEITPKQNTYGSLHGRTRASVATVVNTLPDAVRAQVEIKPVEKPEQKPDSREPIIYFDETAEDVWEGVPEYVKQRYARHFEKEENI